MTGRMNWSRVAQEQRQRKEPAVSRSSHRIRDAISGELSVNANRRNPTTIATYKYEIACLKAQASIIWRKRAELEPVVDARKARVTKAKAALSKIEQLHGAALARYNEMGEELRDKLGALGAMEKRLGVYLTKYR